MSKAKFTLGDYLSAEGVSTVGTDLEQIVLLPLDQIDPDPDNFYSLTGLEDLAGNIETVGLLDPLRVRENGKRYTVVSGHRRRAACMLIRDGGNPMFDKGVPSIIERGDVSRELQELRLIFANSSTRVLTGAELSRQAERVTELLYQLSEQGVKFEGRMRDHVAEAVHTSKSRIGRLHAIRENLDKPLLKMFDTGKMNETVAYALARQPVEVQRQICDAYVLPDRKLEHMTANFVTEYAEKAKELAAKKCKINKGGLCINQEKILEKCFDGTWSYKPCKQGKRCCAECDQYLHCRSRCPLLEAKAKAERAAQREASKEQRAAEKAKKDADIRNIEHVWFRYAQALDAAGLTDQQLRAALKTGEGSYNEFEIYLDKSKKVSLLDYSCTEVKPNDPMPFYYSFHADDYRRLCAFADALNVSLDYLFDRDDVPNRKESAAAAAASPVICDSGDPHWIDGSTPQRAGRYLCKIDLGDGMPLHETTCEYQFDRWYAYGAPLLKGALVIAYWPLPEKGS